MEDSRIAEQEENVRAQKDAERQKAAQGLRELLQKGREEEKELLDSYNRRKAFNDGIENALYTLKII